MKLLWTCAECGVEAVTEKRPGTVTIERVNIPKGWVYFPWLHKAHCPRHVPPLDARRTQ